MEQAITVRFLQICREVVKIPKLTVLNEARALTEEEIMFWDDICVHYLNPEYCKDAIVSQGGAWDWPDGKADSGVWRNNERTVAKTEDVIAFEQCGQDISQIPAIEERLLNMAALMMHGATFCKRYANTVMLAPVFTRFTSEDNGKINVNIRARYKYRHITCVSVCKCHRIVTDFSVYETAEEKEMRRAQRNHWGEIADSVLDHE